MFHSPYEFGVHDRRGVGTMDPDAAYDDRAETDVSPPLDDGEGDATSWKDADEDEAARNPNSGKGDGPLPASNETARATSSPKPTGVADSASQHPQQTMDDVQEQSLPLPAAAEDAMHTDLAQQRRHQQTAALASLESVVVSGMDNVASLDVGVVEALACHGENGTAALIPISNGTDEAGLPTTSDDDESPAGVVFRHEDEEEDEEENGSNPPVVAVKSTNAMEMNVVGSSFSSSLEQDQQAATAAAAAVPDIRSVSTSLDNGGGVCGGQGIGKNDDDAALSMQSISLATVQSSTVEPTFFPHNNSLLSPPHDDDDPPVPAAAAAAHRMPTDIDVGGGDGGIASSTEASRLTTATEDNCLPAPTGMDVPVAQPVVQDGITQDVQTFVSFSQDPVQPTCLSPKKLCLIMSLCILVVLLAIVIGSVCGSGLCGGSGDKNSPTPPTAPQPAMSPVSSPMVQPPSLDNNNSSAAGPDPFTSTQQLYEAVDDYLRNTTTRTEVTTRYGSPMGAWDVSRISDFSRLFDPNRLEPPTASSTSTFNEDLNGWDMSSAINLFGMFAFAAVFNGDISSWTTSKVVDMSRMFYSATRFNRDLSTWDTSNAQNTSYMFAEAEAFSSDISEWNVANVLDMTAMFLGATSFNNDLCNWGEIANPDVETSQIFESSGCSTSQDPSIERNVSTPWCQSCRTFGFPF